MAKTRTKTDDATRDADSDASQLDDAAVDQPIDGDVSFEDALYRLADAVRQLEQGNLSLDESLAQYEDGIRHLSQCQKILETAERKIEILSGFDADGNPITEDFDDENMTLAKKADERSRRRSASSAHDPNSANRTPKSSQRTRQDESEERPQPTKVKKKAKAKTKASKASKSATTDRSVRKTVSSDAASDSNASVSFREETSQSGGGRSVAREDSPDSEENLDVDGNGTLF